VKFAIRPKKTHSSPGSNHADAFPPLASAAFVWRRKEVLEVYTRAYDPRFPQVCLDESAKQLLQDKRESLSLQPGQPERIDYTFESNGMCKLFLACEPLAGQRSVSVTERRTSQDWAHFIRDLVDVH